MVISSVEAGFPRILLQELYLLEEGRVSFTGGHREGNEKVGDEVFLL